MKAWAPLALMLAVAGLSATVAAPSSAVAQAQDGRAFSPAEVRDLRRQLVAILGQRDAAQSAVTSERRQASTARADLRRVAEIFDLPSNALPTTVVEQLERWAEQDQKNREKLADLMQLVRRIETGEVRTSAEHYLRQAQAAFEGGRLDDADHALAELVFLRRSSLTEVGDLWVGSIVARAGLARQQWNFARAEVLLFEAEQYEERQSQHRVFTLRSARAENAWAEGLLKGDNSALERAIELYNQCLGLVDRNEDRDDWAKTQNNLGNAHWALGERERGTERLEAAARAYEAALTIYTRERSPLNWAGAQSNLGNALHSIGQRERGTERLEAAVRAYEVALLEQTRQRDPLSWAMTQNNLGNVLQSLGKRQSETERLEGAVRAYEAALLEATRERGPLQWAMIQNNLGNAHLTIGERESGTEHLEAALRAYEASLLEWTRERVPLQWAIAQNNLGAALKTLGERESGTERLESAVRAFRAALQERTRERVPLDWALTQENLAQTLWVLSQRDDGTERREAAVRAFEAALLEKTRDNFPLEWADLQLRRIILLGTIAERTENLPRVKAMRETVLDVVEIYDGAGDSERADLARSVLAKIDAPE